ncbi:MAG: hypothetical protein ACO4CT_07880 [Planctomycetota bacterium]
MDHPWVMVRWTDIVGVEAPWVTREEIEELRPAEMLTVGQIVALEDDFIVVAGTVEASREGHFGNVNVIPRGVILSISHLQPQPKASAE